MASFFPFFSSDHRPHRVCTTFYRLHSRSHVLVSTRFTVNPAVTGSSPCFSQKLSSNFFSALCDSFNVFSALCDFFSKFFCRQRIPSSSFLIFRSKLKFQKAQRVSPFQFFGTMRLFQKSHFSFFFSKIFPKKIIFFKCLQRVPLNFFDILQQTGFSKSRKGSPL